MTDFLLFGFLAIVIFGTGALVELVQSSHCNNVLLCPFARPADVLDIDYKQFRHYLASATLRLSNGMTCNVPNLNMKTFDFIEATEATYRNKKVTYNNYTHDCVANPSSVLGALRLEF